MNMLKDDCTQIRMMAAKKVFHLRYVFCLVYAFLLFEFPGAKNPQLVLEFRTS